MGLKELSPFKRPWRATGWGLGPAWGRARYRAAAPPLSDLNPTPPSPFVLAFKTTPPEALRGATRRIDIAYIRGKVMEHAGKGDMKRLMTGARGAVLLSTTDRGRLLAAPLTGRARGGKAAVEAVSVRRKRTVAGLQAFLEGNVTSIRRRIQTGSPISHKIPAGDQEKNPSVPGSADLCREGGHAKLRDFIGFRPGLHRARHFLAALCLGWGSRIAGTARRADLLRQLPFATHTANHPRLGWYV